MLDELHVSDIALIEDAGLRFSGHLTVLTGETGAGKTALLSALQLICGRRADSSVVSDGAEEACVEARIVGAGDEHVIARRLSAAGRSRCSIDGHMASVSQLAEASASIRVHGQHEQVQLLQSASQLSYLDASDPAIAPLLGSYRASRDAWLAAKDACERLEGAQRRQASELEFMRFADEQISAVNPQEGELEQLESELPRLQNAQGLAQSVHEALALMGDDGAALDALAEASAALSRRSGIDPELDPLVERLDALLAQLEDLSRDLSAYAQGVPVDSKRLDEVLARLDALSGIERRFGPGIERVLEVWASAKRAIQAADASPEALADARRAVQEAEDRLCLDADALSAARAASAERFCADLAGAVHELAMEQASFEFSFSRLPFDKWTGAGADRVELLYAPTAQSRPRPLSRIASGGELSRILLSLELIHHRKAAEDAPGTIVFDEVDAGIGGAAGVAVAKSLAQLAEHVQVVVVTHLPQVAAAASRHYVVEKGVGASGRILTEVRAVQGEDCVHEIARMLAGTDDEAALEHARSLCKEMSPERR